MQFRFQLTTGQRAIVIIIGILLVIIGCYYINRSVHRGDKQEKSQACQRAEAYHQKYPDRVEIRTVDDALCEG